MYPGGEPLDPIMIERYVIAFTNEAREAAGLESLVHDPVISDIARAHSKDMDTFAFSHSPLGKSPTDRALDAGYDCRADLGGGRYSHGLAENIAQNPRVARWIDVGVNGEFTSRQAMDYAADSKEMARGIVKQWLGSSSHLENILDSQHRRIGVGVFIILDEKRGLISETVLTTQNFSPCK